jgi:hypothetical protein
VERKRGEEPMATLAEKSLNAVKKTSRWLVDDSMSPVTPRSAGRVGLEKAIDS